MHPLTIQSSHAMRAMAVAASMLASYAAFSLAERLERATADGGHLDRIAVLGLLVRTAVAAGRADAALESSTALDALAGSVGTNAARATAARAAGEAARLRNVEVRRKLAVAERER